MGSTWGRGVREGLAPKGVRKISSHAQRGQRQHGEGRRGTSESGVMKNFHCKLYTHIKAIVL
jgi:hypothetical protein